MQQKILLIQYTWDSYDLNWGSEFSFLLYVYGEINTDVFEW